MGKPVFSCPVIKVTQPIGTFWVASVPASVLLKVTVPDRLRILVDPDVKVSERDWKEAMRLLGNQRPLEQDRLREIANYIDTIESTFPNSVILSANADIPAEGKDEEDDDTRKPWRVEKDGEAYRLVIPESPRKASVVDGQHRLYAFTKSSVEGRNEFELLCSIFFEMPHSMQAMVFATINTNQRPVRRSLALNMYGYNIEDEPRSAWSPEKLAVFMTRRLNFDNASPLFKHIRIDAENAPEARLLPGASRVVTMAAVVDGILKLITTNYKRDRDTLRSQRFLVRRKRADLPTDGAAFREWYRGEFDLELYEVIRDYVALVSESLWKDGDDGSMLTRAVGVRALLFFLADLYESYEDHKPPRSRVALKGVLDGLRKLAQQAFDRSKKINFADPFFEATGRGQTRIRNALRVSADVTTVGDLPAAERDEYRRVLRRSGNAS